MRERGGPRWRRRAAAAAVAVAAVAGWAAPASAHATVVGSTPADGSVSGVPPAQISVRFDERVQPTLASFSLRSKGDLVTPLETVTQGSGGTELIVQLPELAEGVYRVAYKVRDPLDLHVTSGTIVFGVGNVTVAAGGGDQRTAPSAVDVALRWLERCGLAVVVGGVLLLLLVLPRLGAEVAAVRRALALVGLAAGVQGAALVGLFVREALDVGGPFLTTAGRLVSSSSFGRRLVAEAIVSVALVVASRLLGPLVDAALLERWRRRRFGELGFALAAMALALPLLVGLAGHASTGGAYAVGVLVRVVHLVAVGAWAGGLAVLVALRRQVRRPAALVASFSTVALWAVVALVATGLVLTGREVATVTALLSSWFGRLLLAKLAAIALVAVWGVRHARAVGRGRAVRTSGLRTEAALALAVVLGGAALSTTPPAVGAYYGPAPKASANAPSQTIGDVVFKLAVRPNRVGPNLVTATAASSRRPEPAPITGVSIDLRPLDVEPATPVKATSGPAVGGVVDFGELQLRDAGRYQVEVQIERPGAPLGLSIFQWTVDPPSTPRAPTVVSDASLSPWANGGAVAAALVGVALVVARRRRGAPVPPDDAPEPAGAGGRRSPGG